MSVSGKEVSRVLTEFEYHRPGQRGGHVCQGAHLKPSNCIVYCAEGHAPKREPSPKNACPNLATCLGSKGLPLVGGFLPPPDNLPGGLRDEFS